ncbi:hypothetical protein [Metabacillus niabensis]|uniref:hypothetical protein n=1 Tax=Metabacillus niabensis TaxID=324854 RepID=UPI00119DCB99
MKIEVNDKTKKFYLATDKWKPVVGHEIKVGKYKFCAIPINDFVNVSEVTSGAKVFNIPMTSEIIIGTQSKDDSMRFLKKIGESLSRIISSIDNFDTHIEKMKKIAFERLGEMPPIENVDMDWVFEDVSDVLN